MSWSDKVANKKLRVDATCREARWRHVGVTTPFVRSDVNVAPSHHLLFLLDILLLDIDNVYEELTINVAVITAETYTLQSDSDIEAPSTPTT